MRYAIMSDIHANYPALEAVIALIERQPIDCSMCLGDVVGYYPDSPQVITKLDKYELLQPRPCRCDGVDTTQRLWIKGNHEWGLLHEQYEADMSTSARQTIRRTRDQLSEPENILLKNILSSLPKRIDVDLGDSLNATLVHATPADPVGINSYLQHTEDARNAGMAFDSQICCVGHTHYPRIFYMDLFLGEPKWNRLDIGHQWKYEEPYEFGDKRVILNPGSVGQPRHGSPDPTYAVLDTRERTFTVFSFTYRIDKTQQRVREWLRDISRDLLDLDGHAGLAGRLETGIG